MFAAGLAHITLPRSSDEAWVSGGVYGLLFAADTAEVSIDGHKTEYPSSLQTVALQIPTQDGKIPPHKVLHSGPCSIAEQRSLGGLD